MRIQLHDYLPYDRSLLWRISDAYFAKRGGEAWGDNGDIPWHSTSNYGIARQHAGFLVAHVERLKAAGLLREDERVDVLDVGAGGGQFCVSMMRALSHGCGDAGRELLARLRYVLSDYAPAIVEAASQLKDLAPAVRDGTVVPALLDLRNPDDITTVNGKMLRVKPLAIYANYVCCVSPTKPLRRVGQQWYELQASVATSVDEDEWEAIPGPDDVIADLLERADEDGLLKSLQIRYEWQATTLDELFGVKGHTAHGKQHHAVATAILEGLEQGTVWYPSGFIELLDYMRGIMHPRGMVVVNDYGSIAGEELEGRQDKEPQLYGNTINHDVNFQVFVGLARATDWCLLLTDDRLRSLHTAVLLRDSEDAVILREPFDGIYRACQDGEDLVDFSLAAQLFVEAKDWGQAVRLWARCIDIDNGDPALYYQLADALFGDGKYLAAIHYCEQGLDLDEHGTQDFSFMLGRCHAMLDRYAEAIDWYKVSLTREDHPVTHSNMGMAYQAQGDFQRAFQEISEALRLDPQDKNARSCLKSLRNAWWEHSVKTELCSSLTPHYEDEAYAE